MEICDACLLWNVFFYHILTIEPYFVWGLSVPLTPYLKVTLVFVVILNCFILRRIMRLEDVFRIMCCYRCKNVCAKENRWRRVIEFRDTCSCVLNSLSYIKIIRRYFFIIYKSYHVACTISLLIYSFIIWHENMQWVIVLFSVKIIILLELIHILYKFNFLKLNMSNVIGHIHSIWRVTW